MLITGSVLVHSFILLLFLAENKVRCDDFLRLYNYKVPASELKLAATFSTEDCPEPLWYCRPSREKFPKFHVDTQLVLMKKFSQLKQ